MRKEDKNILNKSEQLDCLSYYKEIFEKKKSFLKKFLKDKEIATKIYLPEEEFYLIKRGSKEESLYFSEINISDNFMKLRKSDDLKDVRNRVSKKQEKIWHYFVPRKMIEMHYACNNEKGSKMNRIFIDIDPGKKFGAEEGRKVILELLKEIKKDGEFNKKFDFKTQVLWTGKGFHLYLLLKKEHSKKVYQKHFSWGEDKKTFIEKWAKNISKSLKLKVKAGHERKKDKIILDTSATPPGKLARCPYSLHLDEKGKLIGVCVPVKEKCLEDKNIIKKLKKLNLKKTIKKY